MRRKSRAILVSITSLGSGLRWTQKPYRTWMVSMIDLMVLIFKQFFMVLHGVRGRIENFGAIRET